MTAPKSLKRIFGRTNAQVQAKREILIAYCEKFGFKFANHPSNSDLWGVARRFGFTSSARSTTVKSAPPKPKVVRDFYMSPAWRSMRYEALRLNDGRCELCGASKHDGVSLHVDHIMPRSKWPRLELELSNLQVLCVDCNMGKSNRDNTDWRPRDDEFAAIRARLGEAE